MGGTTFYDLATENVFHSWTRCESASPPTKSFHSISTVKVGSLSLYISDSVCSRHWMVTYGYCTSIGRLLGDILAIWLYIYICLFTLHNIYIYMYTYCMYLFAYIYNISLYMHIDTYTLYWSLPFLCMISMISMKSRHSLPAHSIVEQPKSSWGSWIPHPRPGWEMFHHRNGKWQSLHDLGAPLSRINRIRRHVFKQH